MGWALIDDCDDEVNNSVDQYYFKSEEVPFGRLEKLPYVTSELIDFVYGSGEIYVNCLSIVSGYEPGLLFFPVNPVLIANEYSIPVLNKSKNPQYFSLHELVEL